MSQVMSAVMDSGPVTGRVPEGLIQKQKTMTPGIQCGFNFSESEELPLMLSTSSPSAAPLQKLLESPGFCGTDLPPPCPPRSESLPRRAAHTALRYDHV